MVFVVTDKNKLKSIVKTFKKTRTEETVLFFKCDEETIDFIEYDEGKASKETSIIIFKTNEGKEVKRIALTDLCSFPQKEEDEKCYLFQDYNKLYGHARRFIQGGVLKYVYDETVPKHSLFIIKNNTGLTETYERILWGLVACAYIVRVSEEGNHPTYWGAGDRAIQFSKTALGNKINELLKDLLDIVKQLEGLGLTENGLELLAIFMNHCTGDKDIINKESAQLIIKNLNKYINLNCI